MAKSAEAFRTISEVADWLEVPTHVLRFWESKFPQVKPVKRAGGRRYYRPNDMALLAGIRVLLHDDGVTIRGVQKILREKGVKHVVALRDRPLAGMEEAHDAPAAEAAPAPEPAKVIPLSPANTVSNLFDGDDRPAPAPAEAAPAVAATPEPASEPEPAPEPEADELPAPEVATTEEPAAPVEEADEPGTLSLFPDAPVEPAPEAESEPEPAPEPGPEPTVEAAPEPEEAPVAANSPEPAQAPAAPAPEAPAEVAEPAPEVPDMPAVAAILSDGLVGLRQQIAELPPEALQRNADRLTPLAMRLQKLRAELAATQD